MSKYFKASEYYPDDKDIYDFLDSQTRTTKEMLTYLRMRGIFCAKQTPKEDLQRYVSLLHFDWPSAVRLVDTIDLRDTEEKLTNHKVDIIPTTDQLTDALRQVQDDRQMPNREVFTTKLEGTTAIVSVRYLDVDTSKSRVIQKREKDLEIRMQITNNDLNIRHTDCPRATAIVDSVLNALMKSSDKTNIEDKKIDLSNIYDHRRRLEFFIKMMREIPGMVLLDVSNIKVDRVPSLPSDEDRDDEEELKSDPIVKEKLKRAVLMGEQLLLTREFRDLTERGFFISSANWEAEKNDGRGIRVEFHAGFNDAADAKGFSYKVLGEYHRDENGEIQTQRKKAFGSDRRAYEDALETSAFAALKAISTGGNNNDEPVS